ncbi:MAG: AzlC family ABC transporter permease [Deltaproteobacteria bacterium]|jgi:4-azaleucine resistance transporter AzlC|nr:AzlC family ABC transporter permease [Deltaproteobacteria bacterium]
MPDPSDSVTPRESFLAGFLAGCPILVGLLPFGLIYGASARAVGLSFFETVSMSLTIFAGSAQLIFLNLWEDGVNIFALALTIVTVNLRLLIYGSSLVTHLDKPQNLFWGLVRAYFLTDESYSISMANFLRKKWQNATFFYLGTALPTWLGWQCMGIMGYFLGTFLPETVPLEMAIPMVFLTLLISVVRASASRRAPKLIAGIAAGFAAIFLAKLPLGLGLIAAITIGVTVGVVATGIFSRIEKVP